MEPFIMHYEIFYINHGYSSSEQPKTLEDAIAKAKSGGFEAAIYSVSDGGAKRLVYAWGPFSSRRY